MLHFYVTHSDKRMQVKTALLMAIILASLSFFCKTAYAVPMTTNFQGFLKDVQDKPLTANVNLSFTLYDALTGGTALWTETHSDTPVQDGVFSVILGSSQPIPENILQKTLYLGIKVNADPEMQPRQTITGSLFAMRAGVAETVVKGAITSDSLTAGSVTMEKVADGAIGSSKLAASAVTGNNIAPNAVTGDKIPDAAITTEKLSADVQQKLAQSGTMPSAVATLNVTDKIKVGTNSLYLNGSAQPAGTPDNSIHTDNGALFLQSKNDNNQNTVINADNTGKMGVGTSDPQAKLDVKGVARVSNHLLSESDLVDGLIFNYETGNGKGSDIISTQGGFNFNKLALNGSVITLNAFSHGNVGIATDNPINQLDIAGSVAIGSSYVGQYYHVGGSVEQKSPDNGLLVEGNVGIGTKTPKNKTDIAGSMAIGSSYAGSKTAPTNGLLVEGNVGIGTTIPKATLHVNGGLRAKKGGMGNWVNGNGLNVGYAFEEDGDTGMFASPGVDAASGSELVFKIDDWERLRIARNGYVYYWDALAKSDGRLKKNVKPLVDSLSKVLKLRGVSYQWDKEKTQETRGLDDKEQIGFIAQEVEQVIPELVNTSSDDGYKAVAYDKMTAVLVEAVKELKAQNDALKAIVCKDHPQEAICR